MIGERVRKNIGFLMAGAILVGVIFNVWYEIKSDAGGREPCLCISTP